MDPRPSCGDRSWFIVLEDGATRVPGARGGELFRLRPVDIQMNDDTGIWTIEPTEHKR